MTRPSSRRSPLLAAAALVAALVAGTAASAAAQGPGGDQPPVGPPPGGPGMRGGPGGMQRLLFEGITLTPAQQSAVDSIQTARRTAMRARMEAARAGGPPDESARAAMMQEMRAAQEQDRQAIRALLTAEQRTAFDANVARMQERMRQRGPGGPGQGPGGRD